MTVTIDDSFVQTQRLSGDFYIANDRLAYVCGTPATPRLTNYEVDANFQGFVKEVG